MRHSIAATVLAAGLFTMACEDGNAPTQPPATATKQNVPVGTSTTGAPLPLLSPKQLSLFNRGLAVFATEFTPATGLGPLFNSTSCAACHDDPVLGGYGDSVEVHLTAYASRRA